MDRTHSFTMAFVAAAVIVLAGAFLWGTVVERVEPVDWRKEVRV